jgi:N-acetylglucosamine-1-phosphate uridyltransferase (contains nucleotidyltransferase and I-patch acetyltransferase domains)
MNKVTVIVCDIKISEVENAGLLTPETPTPQTKRGRDIDLFTPLLFEPLYSHIFSCYTMHFESVCQNLSLLHRQKNAREYVTKYAVAAKDRRRESEKTAPISIRTQEVSYAPDILINADADDIFAFASPFAFTLPENVVYDALSAFFEVNERRADAVIIGSREDPISLFVRGDVYKNVTEDTCTMDMRLISALITKKRPGAQKSGGTFASSVHQINCLRTITGRESYFEACEKYRRECIIRRVAEYVDIQSSDGVMIAPSAKIGIGTIIHPNTQIKANCEIGENCKIGPFAIIENSKINDDCEITMSVITDSAIEKNTKIGPFRNIRANADV